MLYDLFVQRGIVPIYNFIELLNDRLLGVRSRLARAMARIQTNAIVNQTEATRDNTFQPELIVDKARSLSENAEEVRKSNDRLATNIHMAGFVISGAVVLIEIFSQQDIRNFIYYLIQLISGWIYPFL